MRISHSARSQYEECPYKYLLNYLLKLKSKSEKSALKIGDAVDEGLNHLLLTRNLEEAVQKFKERWTKVSKKYKIVYSKADIDENLINPKDYKTLEEAGFNSLLKKGEIWLKEYHDQILPRIKKVIKVQIDDELQNEDQDRLIIKGDFICEWEDGRVVLFDNKTSSIKYAADSVKTSEQLAMYYEALKEEYKIDACGFIVLPKKINKIKKPAILIDVIIDQIPESTIVETMNKYQHVLTEIKQGKFPKIKESCMGKFGKCQYYDFCHSGSLDGLEYKRDEWDKK